MVRKCGRRVLSFFWDLWFLQAGRTWRQTPVDGTGSLTEPLKVQSQPSPAGCREDMYKSPSSSKEPSSKHLPWCQWESYKRFWQRQAELLEENSPKLLTFSNTAAKKTMLCFSEEPNANRRLSSFTYRTQRRNWKWWKTDYLLRVDQVRRSQSLMFHWYIFPFFRTSEGNYFTNQLHSHCYFAVIPKLSPLQIIETYYQAVLQIPF